MRSLATTLVTFFTLLFSACGSTARPPDPPDASVEPAGDPCTPGGHVHRDPAGDWCHCDRGFRELDGALGCEVDPDFRSTLDLGESDASACWHVEHGPWAAVSAVDAEPAVDQFLTHYSVALAGPPFEGTVRYRSAASGVYALSLSTSVAPVLRERRESGLVTVPFIVTRASRACAGVVQQWGAVLDARVDYTLELNAASSPVGLVITQVE